MRQVAGVLVSQVVVATSTWPPVARAARISQSRRSAEDTPHLRSRSVRTPGAPAASEHHTSGRSSARNCLSRRRYASAIAATTTRLPIAYASATRPPHCGTRPHRAVNAEAASNDHATMNGRSVMVLGFVFRPIGARGAVCDTISQQNVAAPLARRDAPFRRLASLPERSRGHERRRNPIRSSKSRVCPQVHCRAKGAEIQWHFRHQTSPWTSSISKRSGRAAHTAP